MPTRRAAYNDAINIGTRGGGTGAFVVDATQPCRFVALPNFPFLGGFYPQVIGYVTTPTYPFIAATVGLLAGQTFVFRYEDANRVEFLSQLGTTYVVVLIVDCLTRGGVAYSRIYITPDPPV